MKIDIFVIDKKAKKSIYEPLIEHYIKSCKNFADVSLYDIFNRDITKAQHISADMAKKSYSKAFEKYIDNSSFNIVLDPSSKEVDSYEFANLLKDRNRISFFIGGAYGFERSFIDKSNKSISLGKITLSHKLVKVVLLEQIFRGLSIINNHPYHK